MVGPLNRCFHSLEIRVECWWLRKGPPDPGGLIFIYPLAHRRFFFVVAPNALSHLPNSSLGNFYVAHPPCVFEGVGQIGGGEGGVFVAKR